MTKTFCDICGKEMTEDPLRSRLYGKGVDNPQGYFVISYYRAIVGKKGVDRYQFESNFMICPECRNKANEAVWAALQPDILTRDAKKEIELNSFEPIVKNDA